jgi:cytoskeletal protein RodZ
MENSVIVCIIALAVVIVVILLLLGFLIYNQMLCVNEVNKRLLLITKESIDKERSTQEQLQEALIELDRATNESNQTTPKEEEPTGPEEPFNPHTYEEQQNYTEE